MSWRGGAATRAAGVGEDRAIVFKLILKGSKVSLTKLNSRFVYRKKKGTKREARLQRSVTEQSIKPNKEINK